MIIAFETRDLRQICEDGDTAVKKLGSELALALQQRLADVRAAESIGDLLVGDPRTSDPEHSTLTISLGGSACTIWSQNHVRPRLTVDGRIDWDRTTRLLLREIRRS
jgi:hypothetical protein